MAGRICDSQVARRHYNGWRGVQRQYQVLRLRAETAAPSGQLSDVREGVVQAIGTHFPTTRNRSGDVDESAHARKASARVTLRNCPAYILAWIARVGHKR